ncbi:MAG: hypothetical protein IT256_08885 [Chitinophagaceae bacterium]|nr:hypothetical protein [Chitinophagaceae bacterium]
MKRKLLLFAAATSLIAISCKKEELNPKPEGFGELKTRVIYDFADDVASKTYTDINNAALKLYTSVKTFEIGSYDGQYEPNITNARAAWRNMHNAWELSEAFQYGPVAGGKYNEKVDTWPIDIAGIEGLLAGGSGLEGKDIENLPNIQRGMHELEYVLFVRNGQRDASRLSGRELVYVVNLSKDIQNNCQAIQNGWAEGAGNYYSEIVYTSKGSKAFATNKDFFLQMVGGMSAACSNLSGQSLGMAYVASDSNLLESTYSNNSYTDMRNNFASIMNVYTGRFKGSEGYGLKDLVKDKASDLDGKLQTRMTAVDSAFAAIKAPLDSAVIYKRPDVKKAMDALDSLNATINNDLVKFVTDYITD